MMFKPALVLPRPEESENHPPHRGKIVKLLWGPVNKYMYTASEDGTLRKFGTKRANDNALIHYSGDQKDKVKVTDLKFSRDKTLLIASGKDHTARVTHSPQKHIPSVSHFRSHNK